MSGGTIEVRTGKPAPQWMRTGYWGVAWLLLLCVSIQVFLAGMAIFESPAHWALHTTFVHFFEILPVILLILAFVGRAPKGSGLKAVPLWLFGLIALQYFTANVGLPGLAALHPVLALKIFWLTSLAIKKAKAWTQSVQQSVGR